MHHTEIIADDEDTLVPVTPHGDEALQRLRPQLDALDPKALSRQNIDPTLAAGRALAARNVLAPLRARMERECPFADLQAIAQLEDRAHALLAAHSHLHTALATPAGFDALGSEAKDARGVLAAIAAMLVSCNLLKQAQVPALRPGRGYRVAAFDTLTLVGLLKENWARIENKVPATLEQLERLRGVSEEVIRLTSIRAQTPRGSNAAADLRQRALTLVDQAYDEARRVVTFLRWHEGDVDEILPPLRAHAASRKHEAGRKGATHDASETGGTSLGGAGTVVDAGNALEGGGADGANVPAEHRVELAGDPPRQITSAGEFNSAMEVFAPPNDRGSTVNATSGGTSSASVAAPKPVPRRKRFKRR